MKQTAAEMKGLPKAAREPHSLQASIKNTCSNMNLGGNFYHIPLELFMHFKAQVKFQNYYLSCSQYYTSLGYSYTTTVIIVLHKPDSFLTEVMMKMNSLTLIPAAVTPTRLCRCITAIQGGYCKCKYNV